MPKFLVKGSYTPEGAKGVMKDGGTGRRAAVQKAMEGFGGKIESIYFALGDDDVYVICEAPDLTSVLALAMVVNASGGVRVSTTLLLTPEEVDAAARKSVAYRAPGA